MSSFTGSSLIGSSIGPYSVLSRVGSGGMGTVYRGMHTQLGRPVALKILHATPAGGGSHKLLLVEARLQASFRHPGIATLYDFVEYNGQGCIVMEFVEGPTLAEYLPSHVPLPPRQALRILLHIVEAVQYLHAQSVIHRDLKPANIKLCFDGSIKVLDFGIAQAIHPDRHARSRIIQGTFEYTAPECLLGKQADQRSDIWSVGVLLYEMLTGHLPFAAQSVPDLLRLIEKRFKPAGQSNNSVDRRLENLVACCLQQHPAKRFGTMGELQSEIQTQIRRSEGWACYLRIGKLRRSSWIRLSLVVAALCVTSLVAWGIFSSHSQSSSAPSLDEKTIMIETVNGAAEVFRNGEDLGPTPVHVEGHVGQRVTLMLKREGFADLPIEFEVDERSSYSYVLQERAH